jgi:FkbM family methyltransferase
MAIDTDDFWRTFLKDIPDREVAKFRESVIEQSYTLRLQPGDTAIDIGAHRARHTIPMAAAVGPKGTVHAIEAAPDMRKKLRARINRAEVPKIRNIVNYLDFALSDHEGEAQFFYFSVGAGMSSLVPPEKHPNGAEPTVERVELRRLDSLVAPGTPVAFIKADIEGAEYHAFRGGMGVISKARPMIVFEHAASRDAERFGYSTDDFFALWNDLDYELFTVFGRAYSKETWGTPNAHDLFAVPSERKQEDLEIIRLAILGAVGVLLRSAGSVEGHESA